MSKTTSSPVPSPSSLDQTPAQSPAQPPATPSGGNNQNLPARQNAALQEILAGKNMTEAADLAGVSRSTLYRWMESDAQFRAAYNQWLSQIKFHTSSRLATLSDAAVEAVQKALETGDAKLGMALLKSMGYLTEQHPGFSDPSDVARGMEIDARKREVRLRQGEEHVEDDEDLLIPRTPEEWDRRENPGKYKKK